MMVAAEGRHALLQSSRRLFDELLLSQEMVCDWSADGLFYVHQSARAFERFAETNDLLKEHFGVTATPCDRDTILRMEPSLRDGVAGGWLYEIDAWLRPDLFMSEIKVRLEAEGVQVLENCPVGAFVCEERKAVAVQTGSDAVDGDAFVVAAGAMSPLIQDDLGCRLRIQPGKGYSLTMERPGLCPTRPMIFSEHSVAVTPMASGYRIGSTMEFAGYDSSLNRSRLRALLDGAAVYLKEPSTVPIREEWCGWRPMTPDGLPYIGQAPKLTNVWVAAGHNMVGMSMGPATGLLISELINDEAPHIDPRPYSLARR